MRAQMRGREEVRMSDGEMAQAEKIDIGACRALKATCISETGWASNDRLMQDIASGGGVTASQWRMPWGADNARGSCSLLEIEGLDGSRRRFLIDAGWSRDYMRERFAATGVDALLRAGAIEAVFLTHEHMDHLFGLQAVLELKPDIALYIPSTFSDDARRFIAGADVPEAHAGNAAAHTGELIQLGAGRVHALAPGLAAVGFDLPIILGIVGEQSLYANIEGKGLVAVTGCGHQGVERIMAFARDHLAGGTEVYGLYGGLHLAPFGPLAPEKEEMIRSMGKYRLKRIACNHCTGLAAVELMLKLGYPVVRGGARDGSVSDLYVGNGDIVTFD
jgi:7,8-dihydropterin-6-yl-methyl-4-(beta-D-ribofuranosyl)aminobenzene 5'-phosphate synthase